MFRFLYSPLKVGGFAGRGKGRQGGSDQSGPAAPETKLDRSYRRLGRLSTNTPPLRLQWDRNGDEHN